MQLLKGDRAKEAGIVYLQDEKYEFQLEEGGRLWSIYGSPVGSFCFVWFMYLTFSDSVVARILQLGFQL